MERHPQRGPNPHLGRSLPQLPFRSMLSSFPACLRILRTSGGWNWPEYRMLGPEKCCDSASEGREQQPAGPLVSGPALRLCPAVLQAWATPTRPVLFLLLLVLLALFSLWLIKYKLACFLLFFHYIPSFSSSSSVFEHV